VRWAQKRLAPIRGISVAEGSSSDETVLRIHADTVWDCEMAQRLLHMASRMSTAKWESGWRLVEQADGHACFELDVRLQS
jgi:hypothetical protein